MTRARKWAAAAALSLFVVGSVLGTSAANAAPLGSEFAVSQDSVAEAPLASRGELVTLRPGESKTVELANGTEVTTVLGQPETVSVAQIKADPGLSTTAKQSLVAAAAAATIRSNHYSQFVTGGAYTVTQNGTFYYDGTRVWVGTSYAGKKGTHRCFLNYAYGVSIANTECSESGTTGRRDMYYSWNVGVGPAAYHQAMTAKLYANGTISGFGATVG